MNIVNSQPLSIDSFPCAIVHIDGDAFFASCEQSRDPSLKGKPVITGKERGIAASLSYEAKALGVKRGMSLWEIKKICPNVILLPSDYETYSLLSKRLYSIVRRYTPTVEEYGIDECFADITGLRRPLRMSYSDIALKIKDDLDKELGFTFSAGLGPNKTIAKIGSKWKKPSGFTRIPAYSIHNYIEKLGVQDIWGIGRQTSSYLGKLGIKTALDFARKNKEWVKSRFTKPIFETWQELNGKPVFELNIQEKHSYCSIQKFKTFTPPSNNREFIFSQLSKNIENACIKLRRYNLAAKRGTFVLKTQGFRYRGIEIEFSKTTSMPNEMIKMVYDCFDKIYDPSLLYRASGVVLLKIEEENLSQLDLFGETLKAIEMRQLFKAVDNINAKFGKHSAFLGSSFCANTFAQHLGDRGDIPQRKSIFFKGENKRQRISIPMFIGNMQ